MKSWFPRVKLPRFARLKQGGFLLNPFRFGGGGGGGGGGTWPNVTTTAKKQVDADSTDFTITTDAALTSGRPVIVCLGHYSATATITGVTVNGTAATLDAGATSAQTRAQIWRVNSQTGGSSVVITYSGGSDNYVTASVIELQGAAATPLDAGTPNTATGTGNVPAVTTGATTSQNDTITIAVVIDSAFTANPTFSAPTGWTGTLHTENAGGVHVTGCAAYNVETTTGSKTATFGAANTPTWACAIASYKKA